MRPCIRLAWLVSVLASTSCAQKADDYARPDCSALAGCTTGAGSESSSSDDGGSDPTTVASTTVDSGADASATTVTEGGSESSDGSSSDAGGDTSSTGEPVDNMYAPCTADDQCSSGVCRHGFCTTVCSSPGEGETPCAPPPDDAVGVTIVCATIGQPRGFDHFCGTCTDCEQYCIAECNLDSACPSGGSCVIDFCSPGMAYCGSAIAEFDDASCADGLDNDDDGFTDCDDFDCSSNPVVTVCGSENNDVACMDGADNDEDGFTDCDDFDCSMNPAVTVCP